MKLTNPSIHGKIEEGSYLQKKIKELLALAFLKIKKVKTYCFYSPLITNTESYKNIKFHNL
jgi:hypothetical protein